MTTGRAARSALRLTIRQLQVIVAYCAVLLGLAALPMRAPSEVFWFAVLFDVAAVPLAMATLTLLLVRGGPARDRIIAGLLAAPLGLVLVVLNVALFDGRPVIGEIALTDVLLGSAFAFCVRRAVRPRRPPPARPVEIPLDSRSRTC